jgi:hypothetical protein
VTDVEVSKWFAEPTFPDDTWGRRGESFTDWLARSTLPRAVAARRFLNSNLATLPVAIQPVLFAALRTRWQSAFFEMIVARTLQALGASLVCEPEGCDGSRIDYAARFADYLVNVEAVSPVVNAQAGETVKQRSPLLDIVEPMVPKGWGAMVLDLPLIGPNDSKRQFRRQVASLMASLPLTADQPVDLAADLPQGRVSLRLWPGDFGGQPILAEPAIASWNDTEERIRWAVGRKKRQARAAGPALVAIHAGGIGSEFEDFDIAFFGRTFERINQQWKVIETGFQPSGLFANRRSEPPVLAGALAFIRVGFRPFPDPVLYMHPRFPGSLPDSLLMLERRYLDAAGEGIVTIPSRRPGLMGELMFVPDHL